jgi:hypothetical protein
VVVLYLKFRDKPAVSFSRVKKCKKNDVSRRAFGLLFKGEEVQKERGIILELIDLEDGADRLSRYVGTELPFGAA